MTDRPPPKPRKPPRKRKVRLPTTPAFSFPPSQSKVSSGLVQQGGHTGLADRDEARAQVNLGAPRFGASAAHIGGATRLHPAAELPGSLPHIGLDSINANSLSTGPFVHYNGDVSLTYPNTNRQEPIVHAHPGDFTLPSWLGERRPYPAYESAPEKMFKKPMQTTDISGLGFDLTASEISAIQGSAHYGIPLENVPNTTPSSSSTETKSIDTSLPQEMDMSATAFHAGPSAGDQVFDLTKFIPEWGSH